MSKEQQLNAKDGISLVQTAEGALTEVHSMLNRLVELGVESANGIYQASDRDKIQAEVNQITEEIDRISQSTNFNGIKLLDGSLGSSVANIDSGKSVTVTAHSAEKGKYTASAAVFSGGNDIKSLTTGDIMRVTVNTRINGTDSAQVFELTYNPDKHTNAADIQNAFTDLIKEKLGGDFDIGGTGNKLEFTAKEAGADKAIVSGISWSVRKNDSGDGAYVGIGAATVSSDDNAKDAYTEVNDFNNGATDVTSKSTADTIKDNTLTVGGYKFVMVKDKDAAANVNKIDSSIKVIVGDDINQAAADIANTTGIKVAVDGTDLKIYAAKGVAGGGNGLTLQVGDTADSFNKVTVSVDNMSSAGLGINGLTVTDQGIEYGAW